MLAGDALSPRRRKFNRPLVVGKRLQHVVLAQHGSGAARFWRSTAQSAAALATVSIVRQLLRQRLLSCSKKSLRP